MKVRSQLCGVVFLLPNHYVGSRDRTLTAGHARQERLPAEPYSPSLYTPFLLINAFYQNIN